MHHRDSNAQAPVQRFVLLPVARIEFVSESSLHWPIIGLGTRSGQCAAVTAQVNLSCSFVYRVSKHLIEVIAIES